MKTNIALVGMPLSSKSTTGYALALRLEMLFLDLDKYIEYQLSMTVSELIEKAGQQYFRAQESKCLFEVCGFENAVIATGGGAVITEENSRALKENCYVIWLKAQTKTLVSRYKNSYKRPLISENAPQAFSRMQRERRPLYESLADITVSTDDKTTEQIVDEICAALQNGYAFA